MRTLFNLRHLRAARLVHRRVMRALRHHAMRRRALAQAGWLHEASKPVDNLRAWFFSFFSALRAGVGNVGRMVGHGGRAERAERIERVNHGGARHSLRALPGHPAMPLRPQTLTATTTGRYVANANGPRGSIRQPRRMTTSSTSWYAFALR